MYSREIPTILVTYISFLRLGHIAIKLCNTILIILSHLALTQYRKAAPLSNI